MAIDEIVGDSIDRAVNIEMRFRAGLPRGVTYPLYEAARKKQKKPLTWLAAKLLKDKVKPGQTCVRRHRRRHAAGPAGRRDRRPAGRGGDRARHRVRPRRQADPDQRGAQHAGRHQVDRGGRHRRRRRGPVQAAPLVRPGDQLSRWATPPARRPPRSSCKKFKPAAMIFIEKVGPNSKGIYHSIMGTPRTPGQDRQRLSPCRPRRRKRHSHDRRRRRRQRDRLRRHQGGGRARSSPSARIAAAPAMAALARLLNATCWCSPRCRTGELTALRRRWPVILGDREVLHDEATELRIVHASVAGGAMDGAYSPPHPLRRRHVGQGAGEPDHGAAPDRREWTERIRQRLLTDRRVR